MAKRVRATTELLKAVVPTVHRSSILDDLEATATPSGLLVEYIPIERVDPNPFNPRQDFGEPEIAELAGMIKAQGFIGHLLARNTGARYQVAFGARRLLAAKQAGLTTLPLCLVDLSDVEMMGYALSENVQRKDLTPAELGRGMKLLVDQGMTQQEIARLVGKSQQYVSLLLRGLEALGSQAELQAASKSKQRRGRPRKGTVTVVGVPQPLATDVLRSAEIARVQDAERRQELLTKGNASRREIRAARDPVADLQHKCNDLTRVLALIRENPKDYIEHQSEVRDMLTTAEREIERTLGAIEKMAESDERARPSQQSDFS